MCGSNLNPGIAAYVTLACLALARAAAGDGDTLDRVYAQLDSVYVVHGTVTDLRLANPAAEPDRQSGGSIVLVTASVGRGGESLVRSTFYVESTNGQHNGELPDQMAANLQGLHNTEMALQSVGEALNRDRERRIAFERTVADLVDEINTAPAAEPKPASEDMAKTLEDELRVAQQSLLAVELKLKPDHPDVKRLRRNVDELQKRVEAQRLEGTLAARPSAAVVMDPVKKKRLTDARTELQNLDRQIEGKIAEESRLRGVLGTYQARIEAAPIREAELAALARDYETMQQTYRSLLQKKEESQIAANLEKRQIGEQFKILDPARMPERPDGSLSSVPNSIV